MENISVQGFQFDLPKGNSSIIKVIGVGGGGNNALKHMYERGIHGVDFVICNTDAQTLDNNPVANKVQLGVTMTEGLGAGADPEVGEKAAIESIDDIKAAMGQNTKMVFITAGMGGGTGTGAAPVIAKVAKEMGILTVGIVTIPFSFEGKRRLEQAELGLEKLRNNVDSLIVINNDKLRQQFGNLGFKSGFSKADEVLTNAAKGMAEVITGYFDVNIDFRDAKSVLQNSGTALMSNGIASGENKAEDAVKKALDSPLLNDNKITGAKNVLLLIRSGNEEVTMDEIGIIMDHIQKEAGHTADIIFGVGSDEELGDSVSVLVIATGFAKEHQKYSGPTEKIVHSLSEDKSAPQIKRESPFKTSEEQVVSSGKDLFRLDDEDDAPRPEFPVNSVERSADRAQFFVEETPTEIQFLDKEEEGFGDQNWKLENDSNEFNLFSFTGESQAKEDPVQDFQFNGELFEEEEKPVAFTFNFADDRVEVQEPASRIEETQINEVVEAEVTQTPVETPSEVTIENITIVEKPYEEEISIVNKAPLNENQLKIEERRNKLKEFNSRFVNTEAENAFETIPAFKRKNINIDGENASDHTINSFFSENKGQMNLRENRFLNKDVD
ncbi:cell division protein FtsZ [Elizabethkingia anophelis]|uniref:Cell division protein FtsZ n=1 Tax=Elizabethkingia anophelis TaxID=1117645 RepID=A0AAU8UT33_9FLAO|nr:cell division protein FtsZ [Elizabethkingia anophelis]AQX01421.1 cell division protein FtsZ [Elizabethkingia anophelis]MCT3700179.1 cell division protein FtsZ [Elizabethkingia anophelis]MCT3899613.1 cell division protein FtsZ [Elizabethkingia anophelis]MDV3549506.1 cell division protein FtsZ [Elizabethkingia anophelis]MDV3562491.1 cell division protein FtsZ [Elizabethkingia anophelis]